MPEYKSPGVYVEEVERGPKPIEGVSTSTVGFLGQTERGPTEPRLVTSFAGFKREFGGVVDDSYLAYAVDGFFSNGGGRCYVGRITAEDEVADADLGPLLSTGTGSELAADPAALDFGRVEEDDTETETITLENVIDDDVRVDEDDLSISGENDGDFTITDSWDGQETLESGDEADVEIEYDPGDSGSREATLEVPYEVEADGGGWEDGSETPLTVDLHGGTSVLKAEAVGPGEWATNVAVVVEDATLYEPGENELFKLTIRYWSDDDDRSAAAANDADPEDDDVPAPDAEEVYDNLTPEPSSSDFYESQVGGSVLVDLEREMAGRPANGVTWLDGSFGDSSPDATDYEGNGEDPPEKRTGLAAFELIDEISMVCVPDENKYDGLTDSIVEHCEDMGYRFAILQSDVSDDTPGDVERPIDSSYAAFYYPWLTVLDPETNNETLVPPGGHVAGIYAKSDTEHGVHKAPANEVLRGVQELQVTISKGEQDVLNPRGVNCIRSFRGRGIRIWGARTTSSDPLWKYVNVRRLFLYLEESIDEGTQWAVFEPNDQDLWARVRQSVSNFLESAWNDGALMGSSPEEAFYVKCDRSTMTQSDIDNGRLICEIGVAPVKPAEFVIFRIAQWTGGGE